MDKRLVPECVLALQSNEKDVYLEAKAVLLRIAQKIIHDPNNKTYRSIRLGSKVVENKLLPAAGALECLFFMGFREGTDNLELPSDCPLQRVQLINDILEGNAAASAEHSITKVPDATNPANKATASSTKCNTAFSASVAAPLTSSRFNELRRSQRNPFLLSILRNCDKVLQYEDTSLQSQALKCIPLENLRNKVDSVIGRIQDAKNSRASEEFDNQELLLCELVGWFKTDFFTWMNCPQCPTCDMLKTTATGKQLSDKSYIDYIEVYTCPRCHNEEVFFPRINDAGRLLTTRTGRCGEWSNCFTLICRAMGWDARLVLDSTDHAWTEVYLVQSGKWVHCDPCEGIVDAPLLYEAGWKKNLSYVLAYSCEEAQDVTWRYSSNHGKILDTRKKSTEGCSESELVDMLVKIRQVIGGHLTHERRLFVVERTLRELADMFVERQPTAESMKGRTSGSKAWRVARGETSAGITAEERMAKTESEFSKSFIWKVPTGDRDTWSLEYSVADDCYYECGTKDIRTIWHNKTFYDYNMQRKVERDWEMAYLARRDGEDHGVVAWKFQLPPDKVLDEIKIVFPATSFSTGVIAVTVRSDDNVLNIPTDEDGLTTKDFQGCRTLTVIAELSGGTGDVAWQHTQLFRSSLSSITPQLRVVFHLVCG